VVPSAPDSSGSHPRRPTISDVARAAGVSIAVVSYALNGRAGVSAATRERVLRIADEFGWRPNAAASSLRSGPRAVGLVLTREAGVMAPATFFLDFVSAVQDVVAERELAVLLQIVDSPEAAVATYRKWWAEHRFDVMIVPDALTRDPRIDALRRMRTPAVVLGPRTGSQGLASVWPDEEDASSRIGTYLVELGHREVAVVTGPAALHRTRLRLEVLTRVFDAVGGKLIHVATTATPEEAAATTRRLLTTSAPPSAVVLDSDQMAVAALDVARRLGLQVPWDLSIVAGSDSALCRLATPSITALSLPAGELGAAVGRGVLAVLDGQPEYSWVEPIGGLAVRGSTAPRSR
jgi:DNA-binding LacI/PurR family transcriptional regulator